MINRIKTIRNILNKRATFLLLSVAISFFSADVFSQEIKVNAAVDTNIIQIGDQFRLELKVTHPANLKVEWPVIPDTFSLMEVVKRTSVDTLNDQNGASISLSQQFIITGFDSGFHVLPPFVFGYHQAGDTSRLFAESKPILITVNTISVDTTLAIKDIKGIVTVPYTLLEFFPYILGILIIAIIGYLIYRYFKRKKPAIQPKIFVPPARPAHEIALEQLKALDESKMWQQGNYKSYHTALSDIIRTFILNKWLMQAPEMITDEILNLDVIKMQSDVIQEELHYLLNLSDLVKFAKMIPVAYENEQCIKNAYNFVRANAVEKSEKEAGI